jgi:hypothetical protein
LLSVRDYFLTKMHCRRRSAPGIFKKASLKTRFDERFSVSSVAGACPHSRSENKKAKTGKSWNE